ncbi:MAG: terpene cyclase/mutase family protein [Nitrospinae bacterium]|nr:terpene cyclase/mutase family protein [Nitrospinota bacterium]
MIDYLGKLKNRSRPNGGFSVLPNGEDRPDATAWAAIILAASDSESGLLNPAWSRLAATQLRDGRVSIAPDHPDAFWPTPLAILAWEPSPDHQRHQSRAVQFLLQTSGKHWAKNPQSPLRHDPSLKGWPWIDQTHSWVETTALAMIALHLVGHEGHPRLEEAAKMLLDRQLPRGGWNYGNTIVFGQELRPSPEDTGAALAALAGRVPQTFVSRSLDYLMAETPKLRTPIALGWSLLGLAGWEKAPVQAEDWIMETLHREGRFGGYDTPSLCLLLAPLFAPRGLKELPRRGKNLETAAAQA